MSNVTQVSANSNSVFGGAGLSRLGATCKQILNSLAAMANRPAERSRLAALTPRLLEDIGMTVAERDAQLR
jgi:uncharacterized protein YjiS (DUF1127 family)